MSASHLTASSGEGSAPAGARLDPHLLFLRRIRRTEIKNWIVFPTARMSRTQFAGLLVDRGVSMETIRSATDSRNAVAEPVYNGHRLARIL